MKSQSHVAVCYTLYIHFNLRSEETITGIQEWVNPAIIHLSWVVIFLQGKLMAILIMEKWWMIDSVDMLQEMEDPKIVKVMSNRCKYIFKDLP